jgi:hypothetical protein
VLAPLFEQLSDKPFPRHVQLPLAMRPYVQLLYQPPGGQAYGSIETWTDAAPPQVPTLDKPKLAVVGFSSGKDSTGAALKLREQGMEVQLVHIRGLNRSHPHEHQAAIDVAGHLGMPLHIVTVRQHGSTPFRESVMKNQLILGITLDIGGRLGAQVYAGGNVASDNAETLNPDASYSDSQELYSALVPWLAKLTGATIHQDWMACNSESFHQIFTNAPTVLPLVLSCMMPVRYKPQLRRAYEGKHGVLLMPGRCGTCWKCGQEYLHQVLAGQVQGSRPRVQAALRAVRKDLAVIWKPEAQPDTPEEVFAAIIEKPWFDYAPLLQYTGTYACAPPRRGRR